MPDVYREDVRVWVKGNPAVYYVSYGVFLVTYIALACCPSVRRKYPGNYIALAVFVSNCEIYLLPRDVKECDRKGVSVLTNVLTNVRTALHAYICHCMLRG